MDTDITESRYGQVGIDSYDKYGLTNVDPDRMYNYQ